MKRWPIYIAGMVVILGAGGWYAEHVVTDRVGNEVVTMLSNPSVQNQMNQLANNSSIANILGTSGVSNSVEQGSPKNAGYETNSTGAAAGSENSTGAASTGTSSGSSSTGGASSGTPDSSQQGGSGSSQGGASTPPPQFTSRQQLVNYAMSHFTKAQIARYMSLYLHKDTLTTAQKNQIKRDILAHFTPSEIQDMEQASQKLH